MSFIEHNNRKKANQFAEYITGEALRRYLADKIKHYCGENVTVFDGAAGSGQLEQFIQPLEFTAVEIQAESCQALRHNYSHASVINHSFFLYHGGEVSDCAVMNPPFSMKFKDLSEAEQYAIRAEFPWKKSGVVDDIFMLKGLNHSKRYGFFIMFPGIAYRNTEKKLRELIGNQLVELNLIQNAFEDTPISVLFLVIDKAKTGNTTYRELYDCNTKQIINSDEWVINPDKWDTVSPPEAPKEKVDPMKLELMSQAQLKEQVRTQIQFSRLVFDLERWPRKDFEKFCDELCDVIQHEKKESGLPPLGMML
jgi:type I restriction enzyme ecoR124II M protein